MAKDRRLAVKLTANFERNLEDIRGFLDQADAQAAFAALIDELLETVVPNLERFPSLGRRFLERPCHSVASRDGAGKLRAGLKAAGLAPDVREYVMSHYLLLYARTEAAVYLLSIRHQRPLAFDFRL